MDKSILLATLVLIAATERVPALRFERLPLLRPFFTTDLVYFITGATALGLLLRAQAVGWADLAGLGAFVFPVLPFGVVVVLATVLHDLGGYASHLLLHRIDVLWKFHKVHHSSRRLDWLAAFRAHFVEHALRHLLSPVALILLGVPLPAVAAAAAIYGAWAALGHANLRVDLAFLEPVLVTPRLHRLHHVPGTSAANFGTIFTFWDRLHRTLVTDANAPLTPIGVPGEEDTYPQQWLPQLIQPLRPVLPSLPASMSERSAATQVRGRGGPVAAHALAERGAAFTDCASHPLERSPRPAPRARGPVHSPPYTRSMIVAIPMP